MLSSWRELGQFVFGKRGSGHKQKKRSEARERTTLRAATTPVLENLETRTMLAVLPAPTVANQVPVAGVGDGQNFSAPSIAYDPLNPQHLVTAFTAANVDTGSRQNTVIRVSYSLNGGLTWAAASAIPLNRSNPLLDPNVGSRRFEVATDATVAFDRLGNFYVSYSEHDSNYSAGNISLTKYNFTGAAPVRDVGVSSVVLYRWVTNDAAFHPTMAVDSNLASFTDPQTGQVQIDATIDPVTGQGPIYVAWSTNDIPPPAPFTPPNWNPNSIVVVGSGDGGAHFSSVQYVNDGAHFSSNRNIMPRLTISQGSAEDPNGGPARVTAGQLGIVWDDYWTGRNSNPQVDWIWFDRIENGGAGWGFDGTTGGIDDAFEIDPDIETVTEFHNQVTLGAGVNITDLNLTLSMRHPSLEQVRINLISPTGIIVPLVLNRNDTNNQPVAPAQGISGANIGWNNNFIGTIFDQEAATNITAGQAPFIGGGRPPAQASFIPETGDFTQFYGLTGTDVSGDWILEVTDFVADGTLPGANASIVSWTLDFTRQVGGLIRFNGEVGNIGDAVGISTGLNPLTTTVALPAGVPITDFDVRLTLRHPDIAQLLVELVDPLGNIVPLFLNALGTDGQAINPPQGLGGIDAGWLNGINVGVEFDEEASRGIRQGATPYLGSFQPELNGVLANYYGQDNSTLDGVWELRVIDMVPGPNPLPQNQPPPQVVSWSLVFTTGMITDTDVPVTTTRIRGNGFVPAGTPGGLGALPLRPAAAPDVGIAAGPMIASDNTLGSFSPYQGRLYVVYTGRLGLNGNPTDNTDIFVATSDDGGLTWFDAGVAINDDVAITDGFSEGGGGLIARGRPQFMPSAAVDPVTGTLVVTYSDARYDASRTRVGQFISTSLDGGGTFGKSGFANLPNTALDAITGKTITLGPLPDNQGTAAGGNSFGLRQGLAVYNGKIHPAWSGNRDSRGEQSIQTATATIATGPRIISNTMGPVSQSGDFLNPANPDGTPRAGIIEIQFDRIIDPSTFTPDDVVVIYRDPNTPGTDPGVRVPILTVDPLDEDFWGPAGAEGATLFGIIFDTSLDPDLGTRTGTYSYMIVSDIADRIRPATSTPATGGNVFHINAPANQVNIPVPPVGTGGTGIPALDITTSSIVVGGIPAALTISDVNVNLTLNHTFDSDLIITLIGPDGTRIILSAFEGGAGDNFTNTVFDDEATTDIFAGAAPFSGAFIPEEALSVLQGLSPNGTWSLEIEDAAGADAGTLVAWSLDISTGGVAGNNVFPSSEVGIAIPSVGDGGSGVIDDDTTLSHVTITGVPANQILSDLNVHLSLTHADTSELEITLIAPDGTRIALALAEGGGADFFNLVFDDQATDPISSGANPFTGSFQPEELLSALNGMNPNGVWTLEIVDTTAGNAGTLDDWSLELSLVTGGNLGDQDADSFAGEIPLNGDANDSFSAPTPLAGSLLMTNPDLADPYVYFAGPFDRLTLPLIVPGPHLVSTQIAPNPGTQFPAEPDQVGLPIPTAGTGGSGTIDDFTTSTITIDAPGVVIRDLNVNMTLLHTFDSDLVITLIAPDGRRIVLADEEGNGEDFINTTFDDDAAAAIFAGSSPFTGSFQPENVGFAGLDSLAGMPLSGIWTLEIEDIAGGDIGTLESWSLIEGAGGGSLGLNSTVSAVNVTFDRDMDPTSFTNAQIQRIVGPIGLINGPHRYNNLDINRVTPASAAQKLLSPIAISDDYTIGDMDIRLFITHGRSSDLVVTLIAPDGTRVPLVVNAPATVTPSPNFMNTLLDDAAPSSITTGSAPYNRVIGYRPVSPLSALNGKNIKGTWQLEVVDNASGVTGTLNAWSMIATPALSNFTVTPVDARTFSIGFPTQTLSGTYTISLDSSIMSAVGEKLDQNLNAGVELLFGISSTNQVTSVAYNSTNVPQPVGDATAAGKISTSTIVVPDGFLIQDLDVQLNIGYPRDTDLKATLIGPDGTRVILFDGVGIRGTTQGFSNTILDDNATAQIQNGGTPFFGRFTPQESLNNAFINTNAAGTWTLELSSSVAGRTGTLNSWNITFSKPVPSNGLGETVADDVSASFRIFTQDPANHQSHDTWTPVGPAPMLDNTGRVGGIAIDPSDPSGNTVYVAGASGGIWKSTNFLTDSVFGPTWIPLTDAGPSFSLNTGSISVFGRNNDPNQSIIFVATGEGNSEGGTAEGVGFLRSMDGGATWTLLDSIVNVDANGSPLPMNARAHDFVGSTSNKIAVDPRPTPSGEVAVYAALADRNEGIWRSLDTGKHWQLMLPGEASDVLLDYGSGVVNAISNPTGNVDIIYAAIREDGVYVSPNRGGQWNKMDGGFGNLLLRDSNALPEPATVVNPPGGTPSGPKGRILLAKPHSSCQEYVVQCNPVQDIQYQTWLYALVVTPDDPPPGGFLDGLYVTKDMGQNWTKIHLATTSQTNPNPSNDPNLPDYPIFGRPPFGQGNYDAAIEVDFNNPNVVYLAGKRDGTGTRVMRIDLTGIADPHALFVSYNENDGGQLRQNITAAANTKNAGQPPAILNPFNYGSPITRPTLNLLRDPGAPFLTDATVYVDNVENFANTGTGATWIPFDQFLTTSNDSQRIAVMRDPVTGGTRIILGNDHQVATGVDNGGVFTTGVGTADLSFGVRTGNLQIGQFYYGASQPSFLAADVAGAMFYGNAQDDGAPSSVPNLLDTGNINWSGGSNTGDSGGVATDQTGTGTVYQYMWPCCGGGNTDFFRVNGIGRTFGLLQPGDDPGAGQGQWPLLGTINFAVNPINGNQVIISSAVGRIFGTTNQGDFWQEIGNPAALDNTQSLAMAFGAPAIGDPTGALNNLMYVGTNGGSIFVTFVGGGVNGNSWTNISAGLDGSSVQAIVTNPQRGSHEAYAVTSRGVYWMADSSAANATWVNITGNIFNITHNSFNDPLLIETQLKNITALAADWRYFFPDTNAVNSPQHPVLFVGGEGGVYRSLDKGVTWTLFPETVIDGGPMPGGYLANAHVSDLDLALGNVNPTTGQPDVSTGPDILLVSTFGRGSFAIRMAPIVLPGSVRIDPADDSGISNSDLITNVQTMRFSGISAPTAFGNTVRITLVDLTDPLNPVVIGGYDGTSGTDIVDNWTDTNGRFSVRIAPGVFSTDGIKTIGVHASDESGTTSHDTLLTFTLDTTNPVGVGEAIVAVEGTSFNGTVATYAGEPAIGSASINWGDGTAPSVGTIVANPGGPGFIIRGTHTYPIPGNFVITVSATDSAGNAGVTTGSATVSNPAVVATGGFAFAAKQNTASAVQTVATFTDPGGPEVVTDYTVTINWGDGTNSVVTPTLNGTTFTVSGSHTYAASGSFTITTTIAHSTGGIAAPNATAISTATVALPDLVGTGGFAIAGTEGVASGNTVVATFTDPGPAQLLAAYAATINWGDGTSSAGVITLNAGVYSVTGNHTYSNPGTFTITSDITRTTSTISVLSSATIANPAVVPTGGFAFTAAKGVNSPSQTVATFTDPGGPEPVGAYVATIDWGDGGPTSVGLVTNNSNVYTVSGSHQYAATGTFTITVTIAHTTNSVAAPNASTTSTATVMLPPVTMTGGFPFNAAEGTPSSSQTVARFTDPSGAVAASNYVANIDWGDGTSSFGLITLAQASGIFTVSSGHTYTEEGSYTIHTTISRTGALDASTNSTATVLDVPVSPTGGFIVNAFRGVQSASQTVATFTDPAGAEGLGEYAATINWGDGRTSPGAITFNAGSQVFTVKGDHLYNAEGLFTISVTIQHGTAQNRSAISSANVVHPPLVVTGGLTYAAIEGKLMTLPVATFTDPVQGSEATSNYSATVNWGDGTSDVTGVTGRVFITVDQATGIFTVHGVHTYSEEGTRQITIAVRYRTEPSSSVTSTAVIADPAVVVTGGLTVNGTEAVTFTNKTVATFTDPGGAEPLADYSAMINWGDGNSSAGVITFNTTTKVFSVAGDHRYNDGGNYTITTTIVHDTAPDASATSSAHITDAPVVPTGGFTFNAVEGALSGVQTVATFTDVGVPKAIGAYTVEIEWGDQSPSTAGTLTFNAGTGLFTVRGQHLYASKGTFTIHVTISHGTAPEKTVSSTANVANAAVTVTPSASLPSVNEGVSFTGNLATFVDANPASVASMFTVSIDWGDGQSSAGTITVDPNNSQRYFVSGTHTFGDGTSTKTITIKVRDAAAGEDMTPKTVSIQVLNVKPTVSIEAPDSTIFRGFNANFSLAGFDAATDKAAGFTYTINWGDGSAIQTIARAAGNANRTVGHTFNSLATSHITVRATDKDGAISDVAALDVTPEAPPTLASQSVNHGLKMRSRITDIDFTLSADVGLGLSDLKLMRAGVAVSLSAAGFSYDSGTASVHLDMRRVRLKLSANYSLLIDTGAGTLHVDFFKLTGDVNGDRRVNKKDVKAVNRSMNRRIGQPRFNANADVTANNKVDKKDLNLVKKNLKKRLPRG